MQNIEQCLNKVREGFAGLSFSEEQKEVALRYLQDWLAKANFADYRPQINYLIENEEWDVLFDSFYQIISFGTGGRRGPVGVGPNRINPWTIGASVQGHTEYLREQFSADSESAEDLKVVIAYDVRIFKDSRGVYSKDVPNPLLNKTSKDFAKIAASVYAANGIQVYMLPGDANRYMATPELSFAIRHLKAHGGLNVSASHNPPDDNGAKFYDQRGGQEIAPNDQRMADHVARVEEVKAIDLEEARRRELICTVGPQVHEEYVKHNMSQSLLPDARSAVVVYTPLNGTGDGTVKEVLERSGFNLHIVEEQAAHDGEFPNVKYRVPNPEVPESMELAIEKAKAMGADIVLSTDPDADRIGVCVPNAKGEWIFLNGNEIGAVITYFKLDQLKQQGRLPSNPLVVKTEVTTELIRKIADSFGAKTIGNLLVGFKYIAYVLHCLETQGEFEGVKGSPDDFVIGIEESHGILVTPHVRDKDAAGAALLLAELASIQKEKGSSVTAYLDSIYKRSGYYRNYLMPLVMTGAKGNADIRKIQDALRSNPPKEIGGIAVANFTDHWDESGVFGPVKSDTDKSSRNVLIFTLNEGTRVIIRPSGTEPKNKSYIEVNSDPLGEDAPDEQLQSVKTEINSIAQKIADDFARKTLSVIDVNMPDHGLRVSGLISLENRIDFVEKFIPQFEEKCSEVTRSERTKQDVSEWIDKRLADYAKDPRSLVADGVRAYIQQQREKLKDRPDSRKGYLTMMEAIFFEEKVRLKVI